MAFSKYAGALNSGGATGPIIGAAPTPTLSREIFVFLFFAAFSLCLICSSNDFVDNASP